MPLIEADEVAVSQLMKWQAPVAGNERRILQQKIAIDTVRLDGDLVVHGKGERRLRLFQRHAATASRVYGHRSRWSGTLISTDLSDQAEDEDALWRGQRADQHGQHVEFLAECAFASGPSHCFRRLGDGSKSGGRGRETAEAVSPVVSKICPNHSGASARWSKSGRRPATSPGIDPNRRSP